MTCTEPTPGRSCGDCSLCCKLMGVRELDKPKGMWCRHFARGVGCDIYGNRPGECRTFVCQWLVNERVDADWKPNKCKMVLVGNGVEKLEVHVDPGSPGPWREPHLSWLRRMAAHGLTRGGMVLVMDKGRTTVVLPDRNIDLGMVDALDKIVLAENPQDGKWEASVMKRDEAERFAAQAALNRKNAAADKIQER